MWNSLWYLQGTGSSTTVYIVGPDMDANIATAILSAKIQTPDLSGQVQLPALSANLVTPDLQGEIEIDG